MKKVLTGLIILMTIVSKKYVTFQRMCHCHEQDFGPEYLNKIKECFVRHSFERKGLNYDLDTLHVIILDCK